MSWQHLLAFLVAVCLLVTVHEFGHYWVARKLGFKVLRFSVGFGRPLWKRVAGADQTEYVIAAVPLGGYVKLLDEREGPVASAELDRAFTRRPHWQRIAVLLAGPAFNFIFAIVVLAGMLWTTGVTEVRPVAGDIVATTPLGRAGLHRGDEVLAVNGRATPGTEDVVMELVDAVSGTGPVSLRVRDSGGASRDLQLALADSAERRQLSDPGALLGGLGLRFQEAPIPPVLGSVLPDGPAAKAGLKAGDEVLTVNGEPARDFQTLARLIGAHGGETVQLRIRRGQAEQTVAVAVAAEDLRGQSVGRIHVAAPPGHVDEKLLRHVSLGPLQATAQAAQRCWDLTALQARLMWRMVVGQVSVKNISGPLSIAQMAGESAMAGTTSFLWFLVLISLALGFMNLLPIPILDGGQVVMQAIEWIKGSPLSERVQLAGQQVGIMLVVLLMGIALYNDIARQFG
jgi:regulator of sigma E protease